MAQAETYQTNFRELLSHLGGKAVTIKSSLLVHETCCFPSSVYGTIPILSKGRCQPDASVPVMKANTGKKLANTFLPNGN